MRHIIQAQPPIIAPQPSTGSYESAPEIKNECKARFALAVEAME